VDRHGVAGAGEDLCDAVSHEAGADDRDGCAHGRHVTQPLWPVLGPMGIKQTILASTWSLLM